VEEELPYKYDESKYPFEPLLDVDYIVDAENYLEDFMNVPDMVRALAQGDLLDNAASTTARPRPLPPRSTRPASTTRAATTTTSASTSAAGATTAARTPTGTTTMATEPATTPEATTPIPEETTAAPEPDTTRVILPPVPVATTTLFENLVGCATRADPRVERRLMFARRSKPAPDGTPCVFGAVDRDEGNHCVYDSGRFGSFGWCFTRYDRTQWGSCSEFCAPGGSTDLIIARIDLLAEKVQAALEKLDAGRCNVTDVVP